MDTIVSATEFKATCLELFDRVERGELERVVITKRGRVVGMLVPPEPEAAPESVFGCMRGSFTVAEGYDLTEPTIDLLGEEFRSLYG